MPSPVLLGLHYHWLKVASSLSVTDFHKKVAKKATYSVTWTQPIFLRLQRLPRVVIWDEASLTPRELTEKWKWLLAPHCLSPCRSACQLCGSREPGLGVFFWENQKAVTLLGRCEFMLRLYRCLALLVYHELVSGSSRRAQARLRCLGHGNRHSLEQKQERERCPAFDLRHFPDRKAPSLQKSLPFSAHVLMMSQWRPFTIYAPFFHL